MIESQLPAGVAARQRPMPARPLHALWARWDAPPVEWFVGANDVVHGTNFLVPPTGRAAAVVSVHDLTPVHHPELCNAATLAYPGLIRRALARGAWVHTDSAFVAHEVVEAFGADPARVRVVHPGVPELPVPSQKRPRRRCGRLPPAVRRFCLAIGTAEPRRTSRAWSGRSTTWPSATPTCARARPARRGGASRRWTRRWPPRRAPGPHRPHRLGQRSRPRRVARPGRAFWPIRRSTRGSGSRRCRPCAPVCPWSRHGPGRCPRCWATAPCWSSRAIRTAWPRRSPAAWTTRQRVPASSAGAAWSARYSWERCGDGLEALYRDAAARPWLSAPGRRCCWRSSSSGGACPGDRDLRPRPARRPGRSPPGGRRGRGGPPGQPAAAAGRPTRWPLSAGRCTRRGCPVRLLTRAWDHGLCRAPAGFDVVHSVSLASPQLRRSSPERLVVTVHDVAWRRHPESTTRRGARWHEAALRRASRSGRHSWCRPGWWRRTWRRWASRRAGSPSCRAAPITCPTPDPARRRRSSPDGGRRRASSS